MRAFLLTWALFSPAAAWACASGEVPVDIENRTSRSFDELRLSAPFAEAWSDNHVTSDALEPGETLTICVIEGDWDVRAVDNVASVDLPFPSSTFRAGTPLILSE